MKKNSILFRTMLFIVCVAFFMVGLILLIGATKKVDSFDYLVNMAGEESYLISRTLNIAGITSCLVFTWIIFCFMFVCAIVLYVLSFFKYEKLFNVFSVVMIALVALAAIFIFVLEAVISGIVEDILSSYRETNTDRGELFLASLEISTMISTITNPINNANLFAIFIGIIGVLGGFASNRKELCHIENVEKNNIVKTDGDKVISAEMLYQDALKKKIAEVDMKMETARLEKEYEEKIALINDFNTKK